MLVFFLKPSIFHQTWFFAVHVLGDLANAACSPRRTWGSLGAAQVFKLVRGQLEVGIREQPSELVEVPEVWGHQQVWEMSWEMAVEHGMALAEAGSEPGSRVATGCVHVVSPAGCPWAVCVEHAGRRTGWTIFSARKCGCIEIQLFHRSPSSLLTSSVELLERMAQIILFPVKHGRAGGWIFYFIFMGCYQDVECCPRNIFIRTEVLKTPCRLLAVRAQGAAWDDAQKSCLFSVWRRRRPSGLSQWLPAPVRKSFPSLFFS